MSKSIFSSGEPLAKPLASRVCDKAWLTHVVTWLSSSSDFLTNTGLAGSSGKTSPVSCHRQADGTLAPSSGRWQNSGTGSAIECWTLNTSECPSAAVASSLSDILETGDVPQRYYLSARACEGILRRVAVMCPLQLVQALKKVIQ